MEPRDRKDRLIRYMNIPTSMDVTTPGGFIAVPQDDLFKDDYVQASWNFHF